MQDVFYKQLVKVEKDIMYKFYEEKRIEFGLHDGAIYGLIIEFRKKSMSALYLLENNLTSGVGSLIRSLFEITIYLEFIVKKDSVNRGTAFWLDYKLTQAKLFSLLKGNSNESRKTRELLQVNLDDFLRHSESYFPEESVDKWENQYEKLLPRKGRKRRKWYDFDEKTKNFYDLCKSMDKIGEYNTIFRIFSQNTHSSDVSRNFNIGENYLEIESQVDDREALTKLVQSLTYSILNSAFKYYDLKGTERAVSSSLKLYFDNNK
ncbi:MULTISPECIES: DUF5677 domain-containing protein [Enterococcus]|uniref:DUF5677 domain-containing protein n=1 Tax=Enterococcus TaxID=1350 RepID=UPI0010FF80A6|nr:MULTISPECIES: DUF5677 domain-containing protein [Enterococcus]QCT92809.1 hypothetical protein FE005_13090 [Enterococcus sp. M190262]GMG56829.1 hypothetical protein AH4_02560 [Enterococcus gallinarum]